MEKARDLQKTIYFTDYIKAFDCVSQPTVENSEVGLQRRLSTEELMLSNCGAGEDSWESPGQKDQISQS